MDGKKYGKYNRSGVCRVRTASLSAASAWERSNASAWCILRVCSGPVACTPCCWGPVDPWAPPLMSPLFPILIAAARDAMSTGDRFGDTEFCKPADHNPSRVRLVRKISSFPPSFTISSPIYYIRMRKGIGCIVSHRLLASLEKLIGDKLCHRFQLSLYYRLWWFRDDRGAGCGAMRTPH